MNSTDSSDRGRGGRVEPNEPPADQAMENESPGDGIMEDDLTEERDATPAQREEAAHGQLQDP